MSEAVKTVEEQSKKSQITTGEILKQSTNYLQGLIESKFKQISEDQNAKIEDLSIEKDDFIGLINGKIK